MLYFTIKTLVSALVIAAISEIAKRYTLISGLIAAIPLTSVLAFTWIYLETKDANKIIETSNTIIWLIMPSISFFALLSYLLKKEMAFGLAMAISLVFMLLGYGLFLWIKKSLGY